MGGGGGGSSDIMMRNPKTEQKSIGQYNMWDFIGPNSQLSKYTQGQPLLKAAEGGALNYFGQLGGLLAPLSSAGGYYADIIKNRGELSPEGQRNVSQLARLNPGGSLRDVGALTREAMGTEQAREQRLAGATSQYGQIAGQEQGLQTGGLNQLLGVQGGKVGTFTQLQDPIFGYLGNLFSGNQQASVQGAQIGAQQSAANKAGTSSAAGGVISGVAAAAAIAL